MECGQPEQTNVFKVSRGAIYDWFTLRAETNSLEPKKLSSG